LASLFTLSGCSSVRNTGRIVNTNTENFFININKLDSSNISHTDYNILKASVRILSDAKKSEFLVNFKYKRPDTYLASIKSKTGIEAARLYISGDTVLLNDRINKRLYYGSSDFLSDKYGVNINSVQLIFGDILRGEDEVADTIKCKNGIGIFYDIVNGRRIEYRIDCSTGMVANTYIGGYNEQELVRLSFSKYINSGKHFIPGNIEIYETSNEIGIQIEIEKIVEGAMEEIVFIPGKNYERILLK